MLEALDKIARDAGSEIMRIHTKGCGCGYKPDGSPVTEADNAAENVILPALAALAPDIPVISEENARSHALKAPPRFFLVDPLDGTREFLRPDGAGAFTVNIALVDEGLPVLGVVFAPALGRMFTGERGKGAAEIRTGGQRPIATRKVPDTGAVAVASRSHRDADTDAWLRAHDISDTIATGSSLKFCLIANGEADVYPRFGPTMEWDTAAGDAVLRAASGCVTSPDGVPWHYGKPDYRNGPFIAWGSSAAELAADARRPPPDSR